MFSFTSIQMLFNRKATIIFNSIQMLQFISRAQFLKGKFLRWNSKNFNENQGMVVSIQFIYHTPDLHFWHHLVRKNNSGTLVDEVELFLITYSYLRYKMNVN